MLETAENLKLNRNIGLDLIRALAVVCVFFNHINFYYLKSTSEYGIILFYYLGVIGVEIFFVLSGFLIGSILLKIQEYNFKNFFQFIIRRWLRTLPLYYLMLIINFLIFLPELKILFPFLLFLQNNYLINTIDNAFYSVSWSLSVEEWFYLIIPFLFFTSAIIIKSSRLRVCLLLFITVLFHFLYAFHYNLNFIVQRSTFFLRFDALLIGFLLASYPKTINFFTDILLKKTFWVVFYVILSIFFSLILFILAFNQSGVFVTISLILINLCCGFILIAFHSIKQNYSFLLPLQKLAQISYPFYLTHATIIILVSPMLSVSLLNLILVSIISFSLSYLVSWLINKYIEHPIMNFRDKNYPQNSK